MNEKDNRPNIFNNFTPAHESVAIGIQRDPTVLGDPNIKNLAIDTGLTAYDAFLKSTGVPNEEAEKKIEEAREELKKSKPPKIVEYVTRYAGYVLHFKQTRTSPLINHTREADEESFMKLRVENLQPVPVETRQLSPKPDLSEIIKRKP